MDRTVLSRDDSLPVPLVDIERMEIVQLLVGTDGIHIGINAIPRLNLILGKRQTLPFGQRMNDLGLCIAEILDGERHRTLHAIQVIIDTLIN